MKPISLETINAAKVGPELDALVHRHLFDAPDEWAVIKRGYYYRPNDAGYTSRLEEAGRYTEAEARRRCDPHGEPVTMERISPINYSTDGTAMLSVLRAMWGLGFDCHLISTADGEWAAGFAQRQPPWTPGEAIAVEAPGAVCRAALLALVEQHP